MLTGDWGEGKSDGAGRSRARPALWVAACIAIALSGLIAACAAPKGVEAMDQRKETPSQADLRSKLSDEQYYVTQQCGTEPAFRNAYWDNHREGIYVDVVSGKPLFSSTDKFDSGSGWPSFTRPIEEAAVLERADRSHGMDRTEVRGADSGAHLGHLFDDGPAPLGARYCINSAALRFIPAEDMEKEGYGALLSLFPAYAPRGEGRLETAIFAAGCFWGTEEYFRRLAGVISTEVGYSGGTTANPTYGEVCTGKTGHAESLKIRFDPARISYTELLRHFFRMHDPTQKDGQGPDRGSQYRSVVFYETEEQRAAAESLIALLSKSGGYARPIATELVPAMPFYPAEDYHQDYLRKNPGGYCHVDLSLAGKPLD